MLDTLHQKFLNIEDNFLMLMLLIFVAIISTFATEMYVPALPAIAQTFGTDHRHAQWSITSYLFAMALSQFLYGPLSDRFGRRPILLLGLSINIVGNFVCVVAPSIHWLNVGRLIQGMGVGAPLCLSRSIARDVFSGIRFAIVGSYLGLATAIAPAIAPILGSYLQVWFGWRSNFIFLMGLGIAVLLFISLCLPETNKVFNRQAVQYRTLLHNYSILFSNRNFINYAICSSMAISGLLVYYAMSPFIFQNELGLSPVEYGWLAIFITAAMFMGRILNTFLLRFFSINQLILMGSLSMLFASFSLLFAGLLGTLSLLIILIPMIIFVLATGLVFSNAAAGALLPFPEIAGLAAAVYGGLQILGAFLSTAIAAELQEHKQIMLGLLLTGISLISIMSFYLSANRDQNEEIPPEKSV